MRARKIRLALAALGLAAAVGIGVAGGVAPLDSGWDHHASMTSAADSGWDHSIAPADAPVLTNDSGWDTAGA